MKTRSTPLTDSLVAHCASIHGLDFNAWLEEQNEQNMDRLVRTIERVATGRGNTDEKQDIDGIAVAAYRCATGKFAGTPSQDEVTDYLPVLLAMVAVKSLIKKGWVETGEDEAIHLTDKGVTEFKPGLLQTYDKILEGFKTDENELAATPVRKEEDLSPEVKEALAGLAGVMARGYTDELKALTKGMQSSPREVYLFADVFDYLCENAAINWQDQPSMLALLESADASIQDLEAFLNETGRPYEVFLNFINHGRESTIEVGWTDEIVPGSHTDVLWDRWEIREEDPVMAFATISFLFDAVNYECAPKASARPEPPLYRYHPERFKHFREYAEGLGKFYRQKVDPASGLLTIKQMNAAMQPILLEANQLSMKYPRRLKDSLPSPSLVLDGELLLAMAYGRFVQAGRQIIDFPPSLIEMLGNTDVDDIQLCNIKLPYAAQYLYFGPQQDMELEPGWLIDGAYVETRGEAGDIRFTVTAVPADRQLSNRWYLVPEAMYTQDFVEKYRTMDLATAIDSVRADSLAGLARTHEKPIQIDAPFKDVSDEMAIKRTEIEMQRFPVYKAAIQLVVNALCYVTAYPDDIDTVWPEGTPDSLKQKVLHGKGKEIMRAKSKLAALGYVPVHICGKRLSEQMDMYGHSLAATGPLKKTAHWRRGHWRSQPHGPARSLRKLIWLMPTMVGISHESEDPDTGHLYLVS